jgi:two-component system, OmpR family, alkaline phosphatase synthesis response regulator PhoP
MSRIFVVEDEPVIALGLRDSLEAEGYEVTAGSDGLEAEERAIRERFDLLLLDVMLPSRDGLTVCRNLRRSGCSTPIILLTARGQETDKIRGLDAGADDYVTKPFSRGELLARVRAALRRGLAAPETAERRYVFGKITVDFDRHEAMRNEARLDLTPIEFRLLRTLIVNRGRVMPHDELIRQVWGPDIFLTDRALYTHMNNLRGKVEEEPGRPRYLAGVRGVGYRFDE